MVGLLDTAGERVQLDSELAWVTGLLNEGAAGRLEHATSGSATMHVRIEAGRRPFDVSGWPLLSRGVWSSRGEVVIENVCTSGFDLHAACGDDGPRLTYRWRPPARDRAAARILRSRFHLLARSVLVQYPALWWAGRQGRVPLHASACLAGDSTALVTASSGVGRSTLLLAEIAAGGRATADNLSVADGISVWGLVEPMRVEGGGGRRMPHGRHERPLEARADALTPDCVVVLERGDGSRASLAPCSAEAATRALVTGTYMAGELRRYWQFAAILTAGTERGPAHPPVAEVASTFAARLPAFVMTLGHDRTMRLSQLLQTVAVTA
jgi:hypothetical protein